MRILSLCLVCLMSAISVAAMAQEAPPPPPLDPPKKAPAMSRFFVGGWVGASFSDQVQNVQVAPEVGYRVTPKIQLGGGVVYRYRKDKRFDSDISTTDLGGSLFGRYFVYTPIYLQLGVEQLNWEFVRSVPGGFETVDASHTAVLAGPGFALPMGPRAASYLTILYDLNYDSSGPNPYERAWMIRLGVGIGL